MEKEKLAEDDRKVLRRELIPIVLLILLFGCITFILIFLILSLYKRQQDKFIPEYAIALKFGVILLGSLIYMLFIKKMTLDLLNDIFSREKWVLLDMIIDKRSNLNYGWNDNLVVNSRIQTKLEQYWIILSDSEYLVEKELYDNVTIGEKVKLSFSYKRKKLLGIQKYFQL